MAGEVSESPNPSVDDLAISGDELVLRRLSDSGPSMIAMDLLTGKRRPTSGAFKPDSDGVSVYREIKLRADGLGAIDLIKEPQNVVVGLAVGEVRSFAQLGVRDDPWPVDIAEPDHPRNGAHALIVGWQGLSNNQRRGRQKALANLPSLRFVYP
jgi:hypothetical protein